MKRLLVTCFCLMVCFSTTRDLQIAQYNYNSNSQPVQKYNAFENRWETTTEGSQIRYNAFENTWGYHVQEQPVYNPFSNRWEYAD